MVLGRVGGLERMEALVLEKWCNDCDSFGELIQMNASINGWHVLKPVRRKFGWRPDLILGHTSIAVPGHKRSPNKLCAPNTHTHTYTEHSKKCWRTAPHSVPEEFLKLVRNLSSISFITQQPLAIARQALLSCPGQGLRSISRRIREISGV